MLHRMGFDTGLDLKALVDRRALAGRAARPCGAGGDGSCRRVPQSSVVKGRLTNESSA